MSMTPTTSMTATVLLHLVIRGTGDNPNHHIWCNNGTWWCHFTLREPGGRSRRIRESLRTTDLELARMRRDRLIQALLESSGRIAA